MEPVHKPDSPEVTAPEISEFWHECIGNGWKPSVLSSARVKHLNSEVIKEALAEVAGTKAADVIAGLIWDLSVTRERDKFLSQQIYEIREKTARELSVELANRLPIGGAGESMMIRAFRKWIAEEYLKKEIPTPAPKPERPKLSIEIRITDREGEKWEELWINGERHVSKPQVMDGNQVGHSVALCLRENYGIDAKYELTGWEK